MAADVIAIIFKTYLSENSMDHLSANLKKGGIKDLSLFFPQNKRGEKDVEQFFKNRGLGQVADWWTKKRHALLKDELIKAMKECQTNGNTVPDVRRYLLGVDLFLGVNDRPCFFFFARLCLLSRRDRKSNLYPRRNSYSAFGRV